MCGFFKKLFGKKKAKEETAAPKQEEKVYLDAELIEDEDDSNVDSESPELIKAEETQEVVQEESPIEETEVVEEPVKEVVEDVVEEPIEEVQEVEEAVEEPVQEIQEEQVEETAQEEVQEPVEEPIEEDNSASLWEPVALDGTAEDKNEVEVVEKKPAKKATKKAAKKVEKPVQEVRDTKIKQYVTPLTADDKLIIEGNPDIPHGKFVIKKTDKGNFVYKLFSYNHRVVCIGGEQYKSQVTCKNGINSVINNCKEANIEDQTLRNWTEEKCPKWQIYKDKQELFRFRLLATNGQSIATTNDGYTTKDSAKRGIEAIKRASEGADVIRNDVLW